MSAAARIRIPEDQRLPSGAVNVTRGRADHLGWGPLPGDPEGVVLRRRLDERPGLVDRVREQLAGRVLACTCPLDQPCHADVLLDVANAPAEVAS